MYLCIVNGHYLSTQYMQSVEKPTVWIRVTQEYLVALYAKRILFLGLSFFTFNNSL